ncbi:MAG: HAMP domain-containing histidine kinase [Spirochaetia bacterium]|nr:HAMP domain-containing histidine kinase [Spirochaetia bacterium]
MRPIRESLKNKLIISYVGITFLALVMVGVIFYGFIQRYASQKENEVIQASAQQVATELINFISRRPAMHELEMFFDSVESLQGIEIEFMTVDGTSFFDLYSSDKLITLDESRLFINGMMQTLGNNGQFPSFGNNPSGRPWSGMMGRNQLLEGKTNMIATNILPIGNGGTGLLIDNDKINGFLVFDSASGVRMGIVKPALISFGLASLIALNLSGLLGWWMGRKLSKPIISLSKAVSEMGEGNLSARAVLSTRGYKDEIDLLASRFNGMASRLEETVEDLETERDTLKNFLSDASHELRTPLTALISYLELLEGRAGADEERRTAYLFKGKHQAERIKIIISKLLELSRMENKELLSSVRKDFSSYRIGDIVKGSLAAYSEEAGGAGGGGGESGEFPNIEVIADEISLEAQIECNYDIVTGMLQNIIGNSMKFSQRIHQKIKDIHISIKVDLQSTDVLFTITDNGPGILTADLPRVFDRFFRSSSQSIEGSGLGLAIVKSGASLHNGSVSLSNKESPNGETGTICEIVLPLHQTNS